MPIRLALIRQRYNPYGGAERFVANALEALQQHGQHGQHELALDLTLITREWTGGERKHRVIECPSHFVGRLWRDITFARCVQRVLREERFDLIQSHERIPGCDIFRAGDGVHAAWLEQRARAQSLLARASDRSNSWHRYILAAERRLFADPRLKAVICISELVRKDILRFYPVAAEKLHVIYNGIDLERFHPTQAQIHRAPVRAKHGIPTEAPLFIFVGSGFERKGLATLLEAFANTPTDAHLLIIGYDKHAHRYIAQAERLGLGRRTIFTGGIQDVRPYYAAADAFVMPTRYEPLSNAVLEALACGLPALVSQQCGAAELITPGHNGYVCDALDVGALGQRLAELSQPGIAASMRNSARQAVAHLSVATMSRRLLDLYVSLL